MLGYISICGFGIKHYTFSIRTTFALAVPTIIKQKYRNSELSEIFCYIEPIGQITAAAMTPKDYAAGVFDRTERTMESYLVVGLERDVLNWESVVQVVSAFSAWHEDEPVFKHDCPKRSEENEEQQHAPNDGDP